MIAVVSDTHGNADHRLADRTARAVREADLTIHAGDFTTRDVFEAFESECGELRAVYGNNDSEALTERLPATRVIDLAREGFDSRVRIALCHGHEHSETALSLLGRQEGADIVVSGHSHRPGVAEAGDLTLLNPGSHADPRWNRPAHAELGVAEDGGLDGRLREPDGTVFREFAVSPAEE
jgi:putative phosphoesterase